MCSIQGKTYKCNYYYSVKTIKINSTPYVVQGNRKPFTRTFTGYIRNLSTENVGIGGMELFIDTFGIPTTVSVLTYFNIL